MERYKAVADGFAAAIRSGELTAGSRLPTHRELARQQGIARVTATKVYGELAAAGLVVGEPGRGTYVRDQSGFGDLEPRRLPTRQRTADLSFNQPLDSEQPQQLRQALRDLAATGDIATLLTQQPPGGRTTDRSAVATYLLDRGIDVPPAAVHLTAGAQHGLDAVLTATMKPGAVLVADEVTYPGLKLLAGTHHLGLAAVPCPAAGTDLDALDALCRSRRVTAVYVMPTVHNPLGFVLDTDARRRLVAIARRHDLVVIEDATYAFLDDEAPAPIQTLAPERTVYVGSFSKNVATGLRAGYVVCPDAHGSALTRALRAGSWGTSSLSAAVVTRWLQDGTVTRLETLRRTDARRRQAVTRDRMTGRDYHAHPAGYSGWLVLTEETRADRAAHALAEHGILVSTGHAFATGARVPNALRLALANPELDELAGVVDRALAIIDRS